MENKFMVIFFLMILAVIGTVVILNMNKKTPVPANGIPLTPVLPTAVVSPAVSISPTLSLSVSPTKPQSTPTPTFGPVTELKIEDTKVGAGAQVRSGNTVTVNYIGRLTNGAVFDTSVGKQPFSTVIGTGQVIKGWDEGIIGMKVGGIRRLIIPPSLAYGSQGAGAGAIPPNATLIFDIELLGVK